MVLAVVDKFGRIEINIRVAIFPVANFLAIDGEGWVSIDGFEFKVDGAAFRYF